MKEDFYSSPHETYKKYDLFVHYRNQGLFQALMFNTTFS